MLAMGAGGLDVACAMGGGAYYISMPKMIKVVLKGSLRPFVTAKDISLEILRILSVNKFAMNIPSLTIRISNEITILIRDSNSLCRP